MILHALTNLYMPGNKVASAGMTKHSAAVHAEVVRCVRQPMAPRRQSPAAEPWVYSDLGSKRQQHDIEPMRKWTSQFGDPLDLWRRSEISYHQSRLFILF